MKYLTFPTLFVLLMIACAPSNDSSESEPSQVLTNADPEDFGLDRSEIEAIESHIQWAIDSSLISGAVALIAKNDQVIYHEAFGHSDRAKSKPMTIENIFRLASMSKPITSVAIMQLVEQGKISIGDPVSNYIPELGEMKVLDTVNEADSTFTTKALERPITIHHLLTHTSGIPYAIFHPIAGMVYPQFGFTEAWTKDSVVLESNILKLANAPLMHQPGESWTYGTSIDVLGRVVEVASGMPLDEYLTKNIFEPLKMVDTEFYLPNEKADRLVEVWFTPDVDENLKDFLGTDYPVVGAKSYFAGGAGLVGTSMDYVRFASALLNGGTLDDTKVLDSVTVTMMFTNQIDTLRLGEGVGFGYGGLVRLNEDEFGRNKGYWGWDGFWQTRFRIDPENDLVLVLMTNAFSNPQSEKVLGGYGKLVVKAIEN